MTTSTRFWEIDLLRTIAIVTMITFHTVYLLNYFHIQYFPVHDGFWFWFARSTAGTFIFVAGVSLTIGYARLKVVPQFLRRGLRIFAWGLIISLITWLISRTEYVRFGILHFFGVAFVVGPLFLRFRFINLILGIALIVTGVYLGRTSFDFPWLLWLGARPHLFRTMDYFPLLPWFGLFLIGMFVGRALLYPEGDRRFAIPDLGGAAMSVVTFPGRNSLVIYLLQWPAIIGILLAVHPENVLPHFPF